MGREGSETNSNRRRAGINIVVVPLGAFFCKIQVRFVVKVARDPIKCVFDPIREYQTSTFNLLFQADASCSVFISPSAFASQPLGFADCHCK